MNILEHLEAVRPGPTKDAKHTRTWAFETYSEYVEFQNEAIAFLKANDHEELLTGFLNNSYYGFAFVKPNSHVSLKPSTKFRNEEVTMFLQVQMLFQA